MAAKKISYKIYFESTRHNTIKMFSISFGSAGQIPNPTGLLRVSAIFWLFLAIKKESMDTFSTGPKLISSGRFGRRPPLIKNPVINISY